MVGLANELVALVEETTSLPSKNIYLHTRARLMGPCYAHNHAFCTFYTGIAEK